MHLPFLLITIPLVFFTSLFITRYLCSTSTFFSLLDHPNERSLHSKPTPRTGGIGILGGFFLGILLVAFSSSQTLTADHGQIIWLLLATGSIAAFSFWDDRTSLPAGFRLIIQFILTLLFLNMTSLAIHSVSIPFVGLIHFGRLSMTLTSLLIVWMTNLYNFMDGMDGLAGGMTILGCSFLSLLTLTHGMTPIAWMSFFIMAAVGGFIIYNFPPAKIFMGDIGSTSLGFMIGAFMVMGSSKNSKLTLWEPVLIFSPFIVDATLTLAMRVSMCQKVWTSHKNHFYQKVVMLGWGHRKTVLAEYGLMIACGLSALLYSKLEDHGRLIILLSWMIIYASIALLIVLLNKKQKKFT